jgi:hypothetical protein
MPLKNMDIVNYMGAETALLIKTKVSAICQFSGGIPGSRFNGPSSHNA